MDPIESFIRSNKKFSLHALINAHSRLSVLQLSKGGMMFDDVMQSLSMSGQELSPAELNAHGALLFESVLIPSPGQKLQLNRDVIANDSSFIRHILNTIYQRCGGQEYPAVEEFNMEAFMFLKGNYSNMNSSDSLSNQHRSSFNTHAQPHNVQSNYQSNQKRYTPGSESLFKKFPPSEVNDTAEFDDYRSPLSRIEFEKSEPIVRLLAQVRKVGMDILFPQSTHDKILACIFVAIRSATTPAHRELIDMVMAVKESNHVSQLDSVSKTKVRGVLALLKHGELLVTQGSEGEPVRLYLAYGINSFKELRERHDIFLNRYMMEHHLFIPAILKSELVWQVDDDMRVQRIEAMNKLVSQLQLFFQGYQSKAVEYDETSVGINLTSSVPVGIGKPSIGSLTFEDAKSVFSSSAAVNSPFGTVEPFLNNSRQARPLHPPEDASNSRFDSLNSAFTTNSPPMEKAFNKSNDGDSPDWISIGRKAAVVAKKANQQQSQQSPLSYFGSNTYQSGRTMDFAGVQNVPRASGSYPFPQNGRGSQGAFFSSHNVGRSTFSGEQRYSNSSNHQNSFGGRGSSFPTHHSLYSNNNQDNFAISTFGNSRMTLNGTSNANTSYRSSNSGNATIFGNNSSSGMLPNGSGNSGSGAGITSFNSAMNLNDRWSQQSGPYYRDDFQTQQVASFEGDSGRTTRKSEFPLSLSGSDSVGVFGSDKIMHGLASETQYSSLNGVGSNFESNAYRRAGFSTSHGNTSSRALHSFSGKTEDGTTQFAAESSYELNDIISEGTGSGYLGDQRENESAEINRVDCHVPGNDITS